MIKALLKKQILATFAVFTQGRGGKRRTTGGFVGFSVLMLVAFASVGYMFYLIGETLCAPFHTQGLDWLYFAFMGALASALGIILSMFSAKTTLYEAKDNDLLFSMPVPSWQILFSRMAGLYFLCFFFEALVLLPALVCYFVTVDFSFAVLVSVLVVLFVSPLGALAICSILGWLLALLAAKLPWKNLTSTIASVGFMVAYFVLYSKMNTYISYVAANGVVVAKKMKTYLYLFWKMGEGCAGDILSLGLFALIIIGAFALVYLLLSKTYLKLATANRGGKKVKYKGKERKEGTPFFALYKKEAMRFTKNPMIALNCLLGGAAMLILPFVTLFFGELRSLVLDNGLQEYAALALGAATCSLVSMNMISASSVSLEGESVWITRSMPVATEKLLLVKLVFHFSVTAIPVTFASIFWGILFDLGVLNTLAVTTLAVSFSAFTAVFGLVINLKLPNLQWTNEVAAVKQSLSSLLSTFAEWGVLLLLVGGYFLFGQYMFASGYLLVCIALLLATSGLLYVWIVRRGTKIFEGL